MLWRRLHRIILTSTFSSLFFLFTKFFGIVVTFLGCQFGPSGFKVAPQGVTGLSHGRVVLVEQLAVGENQADVVHKLVAGLVRSTRTGNVIEFLLDRGQVHWVLDDLLVRRKLFRVDWIEEGPGIVHGLHL